MNTVIGILVVVLVAICVMSIVVGVSMVITAKEIADAITSIGFDNDADGRIKFIRSKNRKDWGIH